MTRSISNLTIILLVFIFRITPLISSERDSTYFFYHGKPYGSEAVFNPATTILNGGFGILQISNRSNKITDIDFDNGFRNLTYNLSHPFSAINKYGWRNFWTREVFPTSYKLKEAQYFPNYELHLIGGGATYRMFLEWYRWHGFPHPGVWAVSSWFSYHFLNEVVENNDHQGPNIDPISDMYIFNVAGILLFSSDKISRFFGQTLHLRDWSFMPTYDPGLQSIENIGQNFMIKISLPFWKPWSLMYHFGVHGTWGLSYRREDGRSFSLTGGLLAKDLIDIDNGTGVRSQTTSLVWTVAMFYDLNNSLLASLVLAGTKGYKVRLNIYPGLIRMGKISPGVFISLREDNQVVTGLHFNFLPFGLARRFGTGL